MKFKVVVEEDKGGFTITFTPFNCCAKGETLDEALENIHDLIKAYLNSLNEQILRQEKEKWIEEVEL